jgi:hypothetical protein
MNACLASLDVLPGDYKVAAKAGGIIRTKEFLVLF